MKIWILQNQMCTEKQMRAAALRHRFFFFSLIVISLFYVNIKKYVNILGMSLV